MGLAIVFSGQGNQYPEMYARFKNELDYNLIQQLTESGLTVLPQIKLNQQQLYLNQYAQPLIAGHGYILWQALKSLLPEAPVAMAGYSLGEITAIAAATNLDFNKLLGLTKLRASLMHSENPSGLLAISGLGFDQIEPILEYTRCYLAIRTSRQSFIVGGELQNLAQLVIEGKKLPGLIYYQYLKVEVAAHTPLLNAAALQFASELVVYSGLDLVTRVVSGCDGAVQYSADEALISAAKQLASPINFELVIKILVELGANSILEIGPGIALQNIVKQSGASVKVRSVDDFSSLAEIVSWVNKVNNYF